MALKTERDKSFEFILKSLLSGGVAGMVSKTTVAPLDRIKILLQAHSNHYKHLGVFTGLTKIVQSETFFALYKGNGAQMVRIFPYAATQFTAFEIYKKYLGTLLGNRTQVDKFLAGSAAGVTAVLLTYPLDTIRARLAFQVTGEHVYTGIVHTASSIFKQVAQASRAPGLIPRINESTVSFQEGGISALYRGFMPTICGMVPYAGLSFYCFEKLKFVCMTYAPNYLCDKCNRNTGGLVLTLPAKLLCGGLSGAVAQSVSYPLDVTRRRMQLAMMNPDTHKFGSSMIATMKLVYRENGIIRGLYRGMSINYLRAVPMVAMSFSTYEVMKQMLNLDTGMKL